MHRSENFMIELLGSFPISDGERKENDNERRFSEKTFHFPRKTKFNN